MPIHLFLVHFPIALLTVGATIDVAGAVSGSERLRRSGGNLLLLGSGAVVLAFLTGGGAVGQVLTRLSPGDPRLEIHTQWAAAGLWVTLVAAVLRLLWRDRMRGPHAWATLAAGVASALLMILVGLSGTSVSHGG